MPTDTDKPLSVKEVAEIAGVHEQTVRVWIREGRLQPLPLPRRPFRIPASELERLGYGRELEAFRAKS